MLLYGKCDILNFPCQNTPYHELQYNLDICRETEEAQM
jgi:hypothetical protein